MRTNLLKKNVLLAAALLMMGGSALAENVGTLKTVEIGNGTVTLPIDYENCQTDKDGKIKDGHFDSMKNGNFALYQINNSKEGAFAITFKAATKRGSEISLTFQILDNEDNVVSETTSDKITNSGSWDAFLDYSSILSKIPAGESKLKIIFNSSDGNYTANVMDITLTPSDKVTYSVTATVTPENSGTVSGAGTFAEGSEVSLTANPAWGYSFKQWQIGTESSTENPYTIKSLTANVEVTAVFEENDSYWRQNVPGALDNNKTLLTGGNINPAGYWENNKDGYTITYLIHATEAGNYSITAGIGTKNDGVTINATIKSSSDAEVLNKTLEVTNNGSWNDFETKYEWKADLEAGDYTLVFTTNNSEGYTLNLGDVTFTKNSGETGISNVNDSENVAKNSNAIYSVSGQRLSAPRKGINIIGGHKYIRK